MNYLAGGIYASIATIIIALAAYNQSLRSDLRECEVTYELAKEHIKQQNDSINAAHEQLISYEANITAIQESADKQLKSLQNRIKNVKTCEDGMNYLKDTLNRFKQ